MDIYKGVNTQDVFKMYRGWSYIYQDINELWMER